MSDGRAWGEIFRLIEQTLIDHAAADPSASADPTLAGRRGEIRLALDKAGKLKLDPEMSDDIFWQIAALKPFYAGTTSVDVEKYHDHMMTYLKDWNALTGPDWRPGGSRFEAFLQDKDCYQNRPRLTRTINAALGLAKTKKNFPDRRFMQHFLMVGGSGDTLASQKRIYANLRNHLVMSEVATYHLMMELGFPVIKPDRVVNRVAMRLGLIEWRRPDGRPLTPRSPATDTDNLGTNEAFAWELQSTVQRIAASTGVSVRKIDYLMVKLGQEVGKRKRGLFRQNICGAERPLCEVCLASPHCRFPSASSKRRAA